LLLHDRHSCFAPPQDHGRSGVFIIKNSRDLILKEGSFEAYATHSQSGIGEGENYTVTHEDYELAYYINGERRDLN
jgi:hypothetical protein